MRLDYFCPVYIETGSGQALTDPKKLQKLAGHTDQNPDSELTLYMDDELSNRFIFDPVTLVFNETEMALFARVGFHEKKALTPEQRTELSEFVIAQFVDGYGDSVWSFRKGLSKYQIHFVSFELKPSVLNYQQTEFKTYPVQTNKQLSAHSLVRGPFKTDIPLPKFIPVKASSDKVVQKLHNAAMEGDVDKLKAIIEGGVNPDARPSNIEAHEPDYTALCWAANRNQIDAAYYLISQGADINFPAQSGTPLMATQASEMITLFLKAGADPSVKVKNMTAAEYHRDQASFYLQEDDSIHSAFMKQQAEDILALAELIENWK